MPGGPCCLCVEEIQLSTQLPFPIQSGIGMSKIYGNFNFSVPECLGLWQDVSITLFTGTFNSHFHTDLSIHVLIYHFWMGNMVIHGSFPSFKLP